VPKTFLYKEVTSGKHVVTSKSENESCVEIDARPGTLYFASVALALSGCCAFVPCHPSTAVVGKILTEGGSLPPAPRLALYGTGLNANATGCFKARFADALPFTFSAAAEGYKKIETPARRGFYRVTVTLAPTHSTRESRIEWDPIPASEYDASSCE
jgi:hypothetical protein